MLLDTVALRERNCCSTCVGLVLGAIVRWWFGALRLVYVCGGGRLMADAEATATIGDDAVLRIVPDVSLAEDALLTGLEILEARAGNGGGEFAQTRMRPDWCWPTLLTHYSVAAHACAVMAAAATAVTVKDQNVAGQVVDKVVKFTVVVMGTGEDEAALMKIAAGSTGGAGGTGGYRDPTSLMIVREWGLLNLKSDDHLRQLAERTSEGMGQAIEARVELAEEKAIPMGPRGRKEGKVTCVGIWFKGKVAPPLDGLVRVGQGTGLGLDAPVVLSEEPLALKPMPGSRRHTAVSMPGWRWSAEDSQMVEIGKAAKPKPSPRGKHPSRAEGEQGRTFLPMAEERARHVQRLSPADLARFEAEEGALAAARGVTPSGICTFAVKYKLLGRTGYECRAGGGCGAAGRGGVPLEPCRFAQGAPVGGKGSGSAGGTGAGRGGKGSGGAGGAGAGRGGKGSGGAGGVGGAASPSLVPSLDTVLGVPSDGYAGEDGGMANGGGGDGGSAGGTGHGAGMEVEEAAFTTRQMVGAASMATTAVALDGATAVALKRQQDAAWIGLMGTALRRQVELYKISSGTSKSDEDLQKHARSQLGPMIKAASDKPHAERMAVMQEESDSLQRQIDLALQSKKRRLSVSAPQGPAEGPGGP